MGKTRFVYRDASDRSLSLFALPCGDSGNQVWWDGYDGQTAILFDDFYGGVPYGSFLRYLDGYPVRLAVKGSFCHKAWTTVYITSNKPPECWYKKGLTPALKRRITDCFIFGENEMVRDPRWPAQESDEQPGRLAAMFHPGLRDKTKTTLQMIRERRKRRERLSTIKDVSMYTLQ